MTSSLRFSGSLNSQHYKLYSESVKNRKQKVKKFLSLEDITSYKEPVKSSFKPIPVPVNENKKKEILIPKRPISKKVSSIFLVHL